MGPFVREKLGLKCRTEILCNRERVCINVFLFRSDHPVKRIPSLSRARRLLARSSASPFLPCFLLSTVRKMVSRTVRIGRMLLVFSH